MQDFHETWIGRAAKGFGPALFVISLVAYLLLLAPGIFFAIWKGVSVSAVSRAA